MGLFGKKTPDKVDGLNFDAVKTNLWGRSINRAKVPGGWILVFPGHFEVPWPMMFYPDPNHEWDGTSLP